MGGGWNQLRVPGFCAVLGFGIIGDEPLDSVTKESTSIFASMGMQKVYGADFVYFCYPFVKRIG
jgi:hypothetical protein